MPSYQGRYKLSEAKVMREDGLPVIWSHSQRDTRCRALAN